MTTKKDILVIHGAWADGGYLREWLDHPRVNVVDLYGHGGGGLTEPLHGIPLAVFIRQVTDALLCQGPSFVVGHSMGGLIAQIVRDVYPDLVKGLGLLSTTPAAGVRFPSHWRYMKPQYLWPLLTGRAYYVGEPEKKYFFRDAPSGIHYGQESGRVSWEILRGYYRVRPIGKECPVFMCAGTADPVFPPATQQAIARFHGVNVVFFEGGHYFFLRPDHKDHLRRRLYLFADTCLDAQSGQRG